MTTRKNPDYSKSAINEANQANALCNPQETRAAYELWLLALRRADELADEIESVIPAELKEKRDYLKAVLSDTEKALRESIQVYGGFQDIENGRYALLQGKKTTLYNAERFKESYPKLAQAVLYEVVNTDVLWALIKAGTLNEKELTSSGVISYKELSPAFIIK